ncbi:MAG: hypothetical protein ACI9UK_001963 [Candidatus Krumholzibacteriia bacterium]|jgi:hypothetical protein
MVNKKFAGIYMITLMVSATSFAMPPVEDFHLATAVRAYGGPETAVMFNLPNGGGGAFTEASIMGGTVDATIRLTLIDGAGLPVANYPSEDCWIESADNGMVICVAGSTADSNTNLAGVTTWVTPLAAGGSSETLTVVIVNGAALTSSAGMAISHNSADINGDRAVNLTDVPLFAGDFYGGSYAFRSDFKFDGVVNLSDVVKMAQALGASCQP